MKANVAIKSYFRTPGVRSDIPYPEVTLSELKELLSSGREPYEDVARLCAEELGEQLDLTPKEQQGTNTNA